MSAFLHLRQLAIVHAEDFTLRNAEVEGRNHDALHRVVAHGELTLVLVPLEEHRPVGLLVHQVGAVDDGVDAPVVGQRVLFAVLLVELLVAENGVHMRGVGDLRQIERLHEIRGDVARHLPLARDKDVDVGRAAGLELGELLVIGRDVRLVDLYSRRLGEWIDVIGQTEIVPGAPQDIRRRCVSRSPGQSGARGSHGRRRQKFSTLKPENHARSLSCDPAPTSHGRRNAIHEIKVKKLRL